MSRWYFVPDDWEMSESLRAWTKAKGLTDDTIDNELESFRDHQYKKPMMRPDACWRNWVKNGIRWGTITPIQQPKYRMPEELSQDDRKRDALKAVADMEKYRSKR